MSDAAYTDLVSCFLVTAGNPVEFIVICGYPQLLWITLCMNCSKQANYGTVKHVSFVCANFNQK